MHLADKKSGEQPILFLPPLKIKTRILKSSYNCIMEELEIRKL